MFIDPDTMQITHLELTAPHHTIIPGVITLQRVVGEWVRSVDYAPVVLDGQTFWMPATITSRATSAKGTFHATVWSFRATYRNFHKLEVTSRILPAGDAPVPLLAGEFGEGAGEALGRRVELRVLDRGAVSAHVDRIHHRQRAAYAEEEADESRQSRPTRGPSWGQV